MRQRLSKQPLRAERRAAPMGHEVAHSVAHAARIPPGDRPTYSSDEGLT